MYRLSIHFFSFFFPLFSLSVQAHSFASFATSVANLPTVMQTALAAANIPIENVGVLVQEMGTANRTGTILVDANADRFMNPASTMKLITSYVALDQLGPAFFWRTKAYMTGQLRDGVLRGNLIFKGSGDPKLTIENFWLFLRAIHAKGIREIQGNLILDRSAFGVGIDHDPAKFDGDPLRPYNVGPDALLLNYKVFAYQFLLSPDRQQVNVVRDPPMITGMVNTPRLVKGPCGDWKAKLQAFLANGNASFAGEYSKNCGDQVWYINPYQMSKNAYFLGVFQALWREVGGRFNGNVISGTTPNDARLITEWRSVALPEVIQGINKYSNNVMARQLLLTLANQSKGRAGTVEDGVKVVKKWMIRKGIDPQNLVIENGAGLSRTAQISARIMSAVLSEAFHSPMGPEFISSLPLVGEDGTMRQRLRSQTVAGKAHIKTGTLNDVRVIAGYVLSASGKYYTVVCIIHHPNAVAGGNAQDVLLQWVYENG